MWPEMLVKRRVLKRTTPPVKEALVGSKVVQLRLDRMAGEAANLVTLKLPLWFPSVYPRMLPRSRHPQKKGAASLTASNRSASLWHLPDLGHSPKAVASGHGFRRGMGPFQGPFRNHAGLNRLVVLSYSPRWGGGDRKPTGSTNTEHGYRGLIGPVRGGACALSRGGGGLAEGGNGGWNMSKDDKASRIERVVGSVPQNQTAVRVMSKGVHYEPNMVIAETYVHADMPPPLTPAPDNPVALKTYLEYAGKTFGRWRVIGLSAVQNKKKKARWVVRCSCGRYENRKAPALRNAEANGDCCAECQHVRRVKEQYRKIGGQTVEEFFPRAFKAKS